MENMMKICKHNLCKNKFISDDYRTFYCSPKCRLDKNKNIPLSFSYCDVIDRKAHCLLLKYKTTYWVLTHCADCSRSIFKQLHENDYYKRTYFFCNMVCVNNNKKNKGVITNVISNTWKEKTQDEIDKIQKQMRITTKEIYGHETYRNIEQAKKTKKIVYGDPHYNNWKQAQETTKKLYGSATYRNIEQAKETWAKSGYEHPMKNPDIKQQMQETYIENNGGLGFASETVYEKFVLRIEEIYDVSHPMKSKVCQKNARNTMKKNGTYGAKQSKIENKFYKWLCTLYNTNDIERQKNVNDNDIDFYISSIDTYIQLDGVYWHGLDRPIEEVKEIADSGSSQAIGIYEGYFKDRKQDIWFKENNLRLVRITDINFKEAIKQNNFSQIIEKIDMYMRRN